MKIIIPHAKKMLDGVTPYRLKMQARLVTEKGKNFYVFWDDFLYHELIRGDDLSDENHYMFLKE